MTTLSLLLILTAAVSHAGWNLLLKKSGDKELFAWSLYVCGAVLLAPLGIILFILHPISPPGYWLLLASAVMQAFYLITLGRAYARGDLSLVYPIARGTGPMLVPVLAVLTLGERIAVPAIIGIALVVLGIYTVSWWGSFRVIVTRPIDFLRANGVIYALLTGGIITVYSLVDKRGVQYVQPFLYMYLLMLGSSIFLAPYILRNYNLSQIKAVWSARIWAIPVAALLSFVAYGSVLAAFSLSRVSYVAPAREVGIVAGVLLGVLVLKEPFGRGRILGSCLIVAGLLLIALSP